MLFIAVGNLDNEFDRLGWRYARPVILDKRYVHRRRKWVDVSLNAIPGYSFCGLEHLDVWHHMRIGRVLRLGGIVHHVTEERMAEIASCVANDDDAATVAIGDWVEVILGPFQGFQGVVTGMSKKSVTFQCAKLPITLPLTMVIRMANK